MAKQFQLLQNYIDTHQYQLYEAGSIYEEGLLPAEVFALELVKEIIKPEAVIEQKEEEDSPKEEEEVIKAPPPRNLLKTNSIKM